MPKNREIWSCWNVLNERLKDKNSICVTYWINKLQKIKSDNPILVTLNPHRNNLPSSKKLLENYFLDILF